MLRQRICVVALLLLLACSAHAQLGLTGGNHPELHWSQIETEHFTLVYHQGLDSIAMQAAPMAEEVYRVVTTNLQQPLRKKVRIYFSDYDEVRNAFAFDDNYIFIWMRGILDDNLYSLRASGTSKWLRSVITHEFTHTVIAAATSDWTKIFAPLPNVPRWFNEGLARFMEPDGWTPDLDIPLRMAAVSGKLDLDFGDYLGGTLIYEGGQSLVRYIASTYGDSAIVKILHYNGSSYDFDAAVQAATKHSLNEIYDAWHKTLTVYYGTAYGERQEVSEIGRKIPTGLPIVNCARMSPQGNKIAVIGKENAEEPSRLYILASDTGGRRELLSAESGLQPYLSWSPDGNRIAFSKIRYGTAGTMVYDLYTCDVPGGSLTRVSSHARLEYPDWSPDGKQLVASKFTRSGSDLVLLNTDGSGERSLTHFNDPNTQIYWPRWSHDGKRIAFSIFRENGKRDIATVDLAGSVTYLTNDSLNDRYAIWSPNDDSIAFISLRSGVPNLYTIGSTGGVPHAVTNTASNILPWDWTKSKDSVLVTSFEYRSSVQLFWIDPHRRAQAVDTVAIQPRYTAWRTVRMPLVTRPQDSVPPVTVVGPYSYNSLAHMHSLALLPMLGTDISREGSVGTQYGIISVWSDEMQKHLLEGLVMYGSQSHQPLFEIEYANRQLWPTILAGVGNLIGFKTVIDEQSYFQRDRFAHLGLQLLLTAPNSLEIFHSFFVGVERRAMEPWNATDFDRTLQSRKPIDVRLSVVAAKYDLISPDLRISVLGASSLTALKSELAFSRVRLYGEFTIPFSYQRAGELAFIAKGAAQFGDELPQDLLGFHKYDQFEGGINLVATTLPDRLRGIRRDIFGNRMLAGSFEIRQEDNLVSPLVPLIHALHPKLVGFLDIGAAWYANKPANNRFVDVQNTGDLKPLTTGGFELQSELATGFRLSGGVGWELRLNPPPDWYFRITTPF